MTASRRSGSRGTGMKRYWEHSRRRDRPERIEAAALGSYAVR